MDKALQDTALPRLTAALREAGVTVHADMESAASEIMRLKERAA